MLRWDLERRFFEWPLFVGCAWILAGRLLVVDAPRFSGAARLAAIAGGLASLAVAVAATYLIVLYVRRPVADPPAPQPQPVSFDEMARTESERAAWRARGSI